MSEELKPRSNELSHAREGALRAALMRRRVIVTRPAEASRTLVARIEALGGKAIVCPTIAFVPPDSFEPLDSAIADLSSYNWLLFTSATAVRAFHNRLRAEPAVFPRIGVVGQATADAVTLAGRKPSFISAGASGAALADELPVVAGDSVLIPCANIARRELPAALTDRGVHVSAVVAYNTIASPFALRAAEMIRNAEADVITFTSPSTVSGVISAAKRAGIDTAAACARNDISVVCIGRTTAATATSFGFKVSSVATSPDVDAIVDAIAACAP